jgi:small subunit ribosomal protein S15
MARMHSKKHERSGSKKPSGKAVPEWVEFSAPEIEEMVVKLGKEGTPSPQIGQALRDQYGVPSVKNVTGKSVMKILKEGGVKVEYPPDLLALIHKAIRVRKHLKENKRDVHTRVKLGHIEAKVRRLVRFYTGNGMLPKGWKYDPERAALLVK